MESIHKLKQELEAELNQQIVPFWIEKMVDRERGGFFGRITGYDVLEPEAPKAVILNTRILWSFSAAYLFNKEKRCREMADRAFSYLLQYFTDPEFGGLYWMLNADGQPLETKKQVYAQAFAIYAYAEYFKATGAPSGLQEAQKLFHLVEKNAFDPLFGGYLEAYDREWNLLQDLRLSDKDANEKKSMNTLLHLLEAYTNLYSVWQDEKLKRQLRNLVHIFLDRVIDPVTGHFRLFFAEDWSVRSSKISYGHDIEGSWLLLEAAELLDDPDLIREVKKAALKICEVTLSEAIQTDGSIVNEKDGKHTDTDRHWWPQAEAMVGFFNAYQLDRDQKWIDAVYKLWDYLKTYFIDKNQGEWHFRVNDLGEPYLEEDKAGPWKCPYHNSRMCIELIRRIGNTFQG
jgi:mannobiose 2-epimerase